MLIGSLGALKQDDLKRLMAYKTINHIGFILMGLVPGSEDRITAICIYLILHNYELRCLSLHFKHEKRSTKCNKNQRSVWTLQN